MTNGAKNDKNEKRCLGRKHSPTKTGICGEKVNKIDVSMQIQYKQLQLVESNMTKRRTKLFEKIQKKERNTLCSYAKSTNISSFPKNSFVKIEDRANKTKRQQLNEWLKKKNCQYSLSQRTK